MSIVKYGREFQTDSLLDVELYMFRTSTGPQRTRHFINICKEIWPDFEWNEWSIEMAEALCEHDVSGLTSGASSGKTAVMGKFALVSWYADPVNTLVVVCSTTSTDAKKRIWGSIVSSHRKASAAKKSVGHLVETNAIIKLSEKTDSFAASDLSSITLVAAGSDEKNNALQRLQGFKNKHVILLLDELQDCSQEITNAAIWNINANERWEIHAAGNATSRYDAQGEFMKPIEEWTSVGRKTHKWKIKVGGKEGYGYHFDATAEDSPNMKLYAQGLPQIPFMRQAQDSIGAKALLGENNATFLRQFVGFWPDAEGEDDYLYTEHAINVHQADEKAVWKHPPTEFAGIDPSFTSGGDRFIFFHLRYGQTEHDIWTVEFFEPIPVKPIPAKGETKDHAAVRLCKKLAEERGIPARNVGADTSGGNSILSIFHQNWSPEIIGVEFGGTATDLPGSVFDKRLGSERFANQVSELWGIGVEFLSAGQIRGLKPDHIKELIARKKEHVAGDKIRVETKKDMKKRLGFSPDIADAGFVGLRVIRERLKITAGAQTQAAKAQSGDWNRLQRRHDVVSRTAKAMKSLITARLG